MFASFKFIRTFAISNTVRLVQLVEHQIVVLVVVGSSPTTHPSSRPVLWPVFFYYLSSALPVAEPVEAKVYIWQETVPSGAEVYICRWAVPSVAELVEAPERSLHSRFDRHNDQYAQQKADSRLARSSYAPQKYNIWCRERAKFARNTW